LNRFDIGLQKEFPVHESMRFEFRAEFLNAFNHPTFDLPTAPAAAGHQALLPLRGWA
jgi:hypothetical protein